LLVCLVGVISTIFAAPICNVNVLEDENYWTEEKMLNAIPRDFVFLPNGTRAIRAFVDPKMFGVTPNTSLGACPSKGVFTRYTNKADYTKFPLNAVGKIFFTMSGANYVCSGAVVGTATSKTIITAGHCVYDDVANRFATNVQFAPEYFNGNGPLGRYTATKLCTTTQWRDSDFGYDYATAQFANSFPTSVGRLKLVTGLNPTSTLKYHSYGYPAGTPFNGAYINECNSFFCGRDSRANPPTVSISCDSTGGSSGGPWTYDNTNIASLNSYGYSNEPNIMYGPYFNAATQTFWDQNHS